MEQHKYTLDTAPAELYQKFMEKFSQDKDVMKLEQKLQDHQRNKDYVQVLKLRQTLQKKKELAFDIYVNSVLYEGRRIDISTTDLPAEVKERMHILYVTAFIGCDIIESAILDMNDLLKKQDLSGEEKHTRLVSRQSISASFSAIADGIVAPLELP